MDMFFSTTAWKSMEARREGSRSEAGETLDCNPALTEASDSILINAGTDRIL